VTTQHIEIETGGRRYEGYTNHPEPEVSYCCIKSVRDLRAAQAAEATAYHEAGHAVTALAIGLPASDLAIAENACGRCGAIEFSGRNRAVDVSAAAARDVLMMLAAGVQSELLWLVEQHLLTPERAWAAEVGGLDDQGIARDVARSVGWELDYALSPIELAWNYASQQVRAQCLLVERWTQVTAVAMALAERRALASNELERLVR